MLTRFGVCGFMLVLLRFCVCKVRFLDFSSSCFFFSSAFQASIRTWAVGSPFRRVMVFCLCMNRLNHPLDTLPALCLDVDRETPLSLATISARNFTRFFVLPYPTAATSVRKHASFFSSAGCKYGWHPGLTPASLSPSHGLGVWSSGHHAVLLLV